MKIITRAYSIRPYGRHRKPLVRINNFGTMPRYPNELQITEEDAKTAIRFAEEIKEFVVNIIKN